MNEIDAINNVFQIDIQSLIISAFTLFATFIFAVTVIERISIIINKPVSWVKKKNADHDLLIKTAENLTILQEQHQESVKKSGKNDDVLRDDLKKLTSMFIDKSVKDMRWSIISFANMISSGERCNKDSYNYCLRTYEEYEKIIEANEMTNGEVEISMEIINESYKEKMKNGF